MDSARMHALSGKMPLAEAVVEVLRYVGDDARLQAIFDRERGRCYDDLIRFPDLVNLIGDALLEHAGSGNQSFSRARETGELKASKVAAYGKLGRLPLSLSQAFLADLSQSLRELFPAQARRQPPASLRDFKLVIRWRTAPVPPEPASTHPPNATRAWGARSTSASASAAV